MNGLVHANEILGEEVFKLADWKVIGEYVHDDEGGRHQAFYSPTRDVQIKNVLIKAGERVQVEQSLKYSSIQSKNLFKDSGIKEVRRWSASSEEYSKLDFISDSRAKPRPFHDSKGYKMRLLSYSVHCRIRKPFA